MWTLFGRVRSDHGVRGAGDDGDLPSLPRPQPGAHQLPPRGKYSHLRG